MAVVSSDRNGILYTCDTWLTFLAFLILSRGDRKEATSTAADADKAVREVLHEKPGKIQKKTENTVWIPAIEALGLRSWLWFVVAAVAGVVELLAVPQSLTHNPFIWILQAFAPAIPSALFVSRQMSHLAARRALQMGTANPGSIRWIARWHSGAAVLALTVSAWGAWMAVFAV
ncbi:hypothetical protein [Streptomyces sp. NBC_01262]|uniref:hypothetical protein n=1 Tax=Streptomyces sp. NBC_01262 TaxID=2903803 RepID=UPI002E364A5C|nr:hypothetical protein [Streptomyces sp. NBC_01262]